MLIKVPVVADVGEVVTVLTVLAVGEVNVVGVVVLSVVHTYGHLVDISDKSWCTFEDI